MSTEMNADDYALPNASEAVLRALPLDKLREYRNGLKEEEEKVSYWRRLVQGRLDLIKAEKTQGRVPIEQLIKSLGATGAGVRRRELLSVGTQEELPSLPGLDDLWTAAIDPNDEEGTRALVEELKRVEEKLSAYRRILHDRVDAVTAELIARYKADPNLSLQLYPVDVS